MALMALPYSHLRTALLRAAVLRNCDRPGYWPDPEDAQECAAWLRHVWADEQIARMIKNASPVLAASTERICEDVQVPGRRVRGAAISIARYLLRATGRPTPFGLFAGVAPVHAVSPPSMSWGERHRAVARPDTEWLAAVVSDLETRPDLLPQLDVMFSNLVIVSGGWVQLQHATGTVKLRDTPVVRAVRDLSRAPVPFRELAAKLAARFEADQERPAAMLTELVQRGLLITSLRAPSTVTDPLGHVIQVLSAHQASAPVRDITDTLAAVHKELLAHNRSPSGIMAGASWRDQIEERMRTLAAQTRPVLAVDLELDCEVSIPGHVMSDVASAAAALLRLTRHHEGLPAWRDYHTAFCERYGTGLAVQITDVVNPGTGVGFPAGYPGSILPVPADLPSERDQRLLELAWATVLRGDGELVLTDELIDAVTGGWQPTADQTPPHVEVAVRVRAPSAGAISNGNYTLVVSPARAGGVLTSRFTTTTTGLGLEAAYRSLPTATAGALPVQLSFPPAFAHAENVSRVPSYLTCVLPLGEHRAPTSGTLRVDDLALVATAERIYLVTQQGQVVEPHVFHALNLDKQPPPLARFLTHLPRAFAASWTAFDWGPCTARLPYLPRVRYGRCILALARWRLQSDRLSPDQPGWQEALRDWRHRVRCPRAVELREDDRTLPLDLDEPMHAAILRRSLTRCEETVLTEPVAETGWLGGHAHEIAIPLAATRQATAQIRSTSAPLAGGHGHLPGHGSPWLYAKVFSPAYWHEEILADHVPGLLAELSDRQECWFVRYRSARETDHLRLRLNPDDAGGYNRCADVLASWVGRLRDSGLASRMTLDTYYPETGRYGGPAAMLAAEHVFTADSRAVIAALQAVRAGNGDRLVLAALGMIHLASGMLGADEALGWFAATPARLSQRPDQAAVTAIVTLGRSGRLLDLPDNLAAVAEAAAGRASALGAYRRSLPGDADLDTIIRSLLHMHHNRLFGTTPDTERTCLHLARRGCVTALACGHPA